jgi:RNA-directed DNA polymerase
VDKTQPKSFVISKRSVWQAYQHVKANRGGCGVDQVSLEAFEENLQDNLYKIWNRMSSGSYVPPPVRRVDIEKTDGGTRPLGIPTVGDRIAQMVVKRELDPKLEPIFHAWSYGYRPGRLALDAVGAARTHCWQRSWVLDLDIKGFFD